MDNGGGAGAASGADSSLNHHQVIFLKALKRDPNSVLKHGA